MELIDGFEDTTKLGSFSSEVQDMLGYWNSTDVYDGTQVTVLASNDSDQVLVENDSSFGPFVTNRSALDTSPHTTTYKMGVGGATVPFSALAPDYNYYFPGGDTQSTAQGTLSNPALGKTYVLGSDRTESWDGNNQPVYSTIAHYYCWDGTNQYTLPGGAAVVPNGVNAATASVPSGATNATVAATQIIGNYGSGAYLWEMGATTNTAKSFNPPVKLNALLSTNSGWNVTHAASLNDNSAIASQGISFAVGSKTAEFVASWLIKEGRIRRSYIGVAGQDVSIPERVARFHQLHQRSGILVHTIESNSAAAEAGVEVNDILIWLDHEEVMSVHELHRLLVLREPNHKSRLTVLRKHQLIHLWIIPRERV